MGFGEERALAQMLENSAPLLERGLADGTYRGWLAETAAGQVVAGGGIIFLEFQCHPRDPEPRRAWIVNMYTEPPHRRRGLARRLMEAMLAWCRDRGMRSLYLHASDEGRPLYEGLGFQPTNEMRIALRPEGSERPQQEGGVTESRPLGGTDMTAQTVPQGYHTATAYLIVQGAADAIEFYKNALGARELMRMADPGGKIAHAEIQIGDSPIMLADEFPEMGFRGPKSLGGSAVSILLYVEDVDQAFARAIAAGATVLRPVQDQFYGDRSGTLTDPFGHVWTIATHKEDVDPEEMERRFQALTKQQRPA